MPLTQFVVLFYVPVVLEDCRRTGFVYNHFQMTIDGCLVPKKVIAASCFRCRFSGLVVSTSALRAADTEFRIQVIVEAAVACPEPEHCHVFPSG